MVSDGLRHRRSCIYDSHSPFIALKRIMDKGGMELDIIVNPKVTEEGQSVIQVSHIVARSIIYADAGDVIAFSA
jgi:hypothetical protein